MEHIQYRTIRAKTEKQVVVLSRRVLTNEIEEGSTDEWDTVTSIAAFNATYRFYWGQIAGLIKALPASATTLSYPQQNKLTEQDETKVFLVLFLTPTNLKILDTFMMILSTKLLSLLIIGGRICMGVAS